MGSRCRCGLPTWQATLGITRRRTVMTRTTTFALPRQRTADQPLAADLRYVTLATHRLHKHQLLLDNVNLEIRRGEVTTVLSRHDTAASTLLDVLEGRVEPSWGSVRVAGR